MNKLFSKSKNLILIFVMLLAIPITYYVANRPTFERSKAAGEAVSVYFSPTQAGVPPNQTLRLMLDAKTNRISFAKVTVNFDVSKVKLISEVTTSSSLATIVKKTAMAEANASGRVEISLGLASQNKANPPTGVFELAQFVFTGATTQANQSASINIDNASVNSSASQVVDINAYALPISTPSIATIDVNFSPTPSSITLEPSDDAYVYPSYPNNNYGKEAVLYTNGSPTKNSYLKFNLSTLAGKSINSAKLRLRVCTTTGCNSTARQELYFVSNNSWSESTLNWYNRPQFSGLITRPAGGALGAYVEYDVSSVTRGKEGGQVSYGIYQSYYSDEIGYFSKENSSDHPKLIVTYH